MNLAMLMASLAMTLWTLIAMSAPQAVLLAMFLAALTSVVAAGVLSNRHE